jgi:hypothetical protein
MQGGFRRVGEHEATSTVIASEAKQSMVNKKESKKEWIASSQVLLAMTIDRL